MSTLLTHASGVRRARTYAPIQRVQDASSGYPVDSPGLLSSIHDARYYGGILSNMQNFSRETRCDIFHVQNGEVNWKNDLGQEGALQYLQHSERDDTPVFRVIFCTIENANNTSFGCQLSLSSIVVLALLERFQISPQFLSLLLGEPDYWAPGDFASCDAQGALHRIEFFCQQPRWNIHKKDTPWSVYMTHSLPSHSTTYVVVCSQMQARNELVKERLTDMFRLRKDRLHARKTFLPDPFILHLIITHEAFLDAKSVITETRYKLYDALDSVDRFSKHSATQGAKTDLERLTIQLHVVSQDTDSMSASADMTGMILRRMAEAHRRYAESAQEKENTDVLMKATDAINYLSTSIESQMRWLNSYKSRKDTAMNLVSLHAGVHFVTDIVHVFNLVTQQDAATSVTIAREAKADGTSIKVITTLTMIFLPGTYLSTLFGMSALENARWWLYVALTLPLTILVLVVWWVWVSYPRIFVKGSNKGACKQDLRRKRREVHDEP